MRKFEKKLLYYYTQIFMQILHCSCNMADDSNSAPDLDKNYFLKIRGAESGGWGVGGINSHTGSCICLQLTT
jgi:hypothetical protein